MRRLPMRKIKDVLRLRAAGRSARQIGPSVGVGRSTVAEYLRRAEVAGLSWPLPEGLDEAGLERLLFPPPPPAKGRQFTEPEWAAVHRELKRPGVDSQTKCDTGYVRSRHGTEIQPPRP
jgi:transposase